MNGTMAVMYSIWEGSAC